MNNSTTRLPYFPRIKILVVLITNIIGLSVVQADPLQQNPSTSIQTSTEADDFPQFDLSLLQNNGVDYNYLNIKDNDILPGIYLVDLIVNGSFVQSLNIEFKADNNNIVKACVPIKALHLAGVKERYLKPYQNKECINIEQSLSGGKEKFNVSELQLNLTIPTILINRNKQTAAPSQWTVGINGGFIDYYINYYRSSNNSNNPFSSDSNNSLFGSFKTGINIGKWRLRSDINYSNNSERHWDNTATYLKRAFTSLRSELTLGQTYTSGRLFDSLSFRGLKMVSDERMLSDEYRGYAPAIIGIANSNALVKILQNGSLIYETTVAPGQFIINDLQPIYSSTLDVEVHETDGKISRFSVPVSNLQDSLRPGATRYSVSVGKTYQKNKDNAKFGELNFEWGLNNYLTLRSGLQFSNNDYFSAAIGGITPTKFGTFTAVLLYSSLHKYNEKRKGYLYKFTFNSNFAKTGTDLSVTYFYYPDKYYYNLSNSLDYKELFTKDSDNTKNRIEARVSQYLNNYGALYGSLITENYHDDNHFTPSFQIGYSNSFQLFSYNILYSHQKTRAGTTNNQLSINASFPLGIGKNKPRVSTGLSYDLDDHTGTVNASVVNTLDDDGTLSYGLNLSKTLKDDNYAIGGTLNKTLPFGSYNAGFSHSNNSTQLSAGAQGSMVFHSGGVTFGQTLGETIALIEAKGAKGATLDMFTNVQIDRFGYAILPSLTPYSFNRVAINPEKMRSLDVELKQTEHFIAPYAGAISKVTFATSFGSAVLITSHTVNDETLPLGVNVYDESDNEIGVVGQGSQVYARVPKEKGKLIVRWGNGYHQQCTIHYTLPSKEKDELIRLLTAPCVFDDE